MFVLELSKNFVKTGALKSRECTSTEETARAYKDIEAYTKLNLITKAQAAKELPFHLRGLQGAEKTADRSKPLTTLYYIVQDDW